MVLTRAEREDILLRWGCEFDDIIDAIRTNIKVKNQRRQTITNLRVERWEEAFENATRRIKRALLLRRSTTDKVRRLQEQAEVAAKIAPSPSSSVSDEQKSNDDQTPVHVNKDAVLNKVEKAVVDVEMRSPELQHRKKVPSESRLMRATSSLSDVDDLHTSISGFSLGNSTTTSARQMEKFYRDLEMEMFGDMPLPDMVGETLEVPGLTIPEEDRVYHEPQCTTGFQEPPSITPSYVDRQGLNDDDESKDNVETDDSPRDARSMMIRQVDKIILASQDSPKSDYAEGFDPALLSSQMPIPPGEYIFHNDPVMALRLRRFAGSANDQDLHHSSRNESAGDSSPPITRMPPPEHDAYDDAQTRFMVREYLSQTVTAMEQTYLHPELAPPVPLMNHEGHRDSSSGQSSSLNSSGGVTSSTSSSGSRSSSSSRRRKKNKKRQDEPVVCHIPPFLKRSPTQWLEGDYDEEDVLRPSSTFYQDPITIVEDSAYDDRIRPSIPVPQGMIFPNTANEPPRPVFCAPQRFPDSVYS